MKRIGLLAALVLGSWLIVGESAWAQVVTPPPAQQPLTAQQRLWGPRFVDNNGDGICDLYGVGGRGMGRGRAAGGGWGPAFIDNNGDGICDNYPQGGVGYGRGRAAGGGWGPAFIDNNGDGICDNFPQGGVGYGRGRAVGGGRGRGRMMTAPVVPQVPLNRVPRR